MSILHTASMLILHVAKDCISKHSCWKEDCGKKHHTFLHEEKKANIKISSCKTLHIQNTVTYIQVLPFIVTNGSNKVKTNALLDAGSDSMFITSELAKQLNLKDISQKLEISNVMPTAKTIAWKPVKRSVIKSPSRNDKNRKHIGNWWKPLKCQRKTSTVNGSI